MLKTMINARMKWLVEQVKGKKILNLGFIGKGEDGMFLHRQFGKNNKPDLLVGLDINQKLLFKYYTSNTIVGSILSLPMKDKSFDAVVLGEVIEHFYAINRIMAEVRRVLKKKGRLYLTTPNPYMFFRWLKSWFLMSDKKVRSFTNARDFLGDEDHKMFWEPLSLINLLAANDLVVISLETRGLAFPYLGFLRGRHLPIWPFTRLGEHICLVATKR